MGGSYYDEEYRDTHSEYELNRAAGFRSREWLPRGCDFDDAARRPEPALHARAGRRSSAVVVREVDHSSEGGVVGRALEGSPYPAKADPARLPAAGRRVVVVRRSKEEEDRSLSPRRPRGGLVVEDDFEARDAERVSRAVSRKNQRTGARVIRLGRDRRGDLVVLQDDQGGDEDVVVVRRGNGRRVVLQDDDGRAYDDYEDYEDDPADEVRRPPRVVYIDEDTADSRVLETPASPRRPVAWEIPTTVKDRAARATPSDKTAFLRRAPTAPAASPPKKRLEATKKREAETKAASLRRFLRDQRSKALAALAEKAEKARLEETSADDAPPASEPTAARRDDEEALRKAAEEVLAGTLEEPRTPAAVEAPPVATTDPRSASTAPSPPTSATVLGAADHAAAAFPASGAYPASPDIVRRVAAAAASPVSVEIEASLREIAGMVEDLERVAGEPLDGESPLRDATNVVEQKRERLLDQPPFASRPSAAPRRRSPSPTKLEKKLLWTSPSSSPTDERGRRDARNARRRAQSQSPYLDRLQRVSKKPDLVPVPSSNGDMVDTHLKSKSEVDGLRFKYEGTEFRESTVGKVKGGSRRGRRRGAANRDYDRILAAELANAVYRARDSAETPAGRRRDDDWPWTAL
ncbi:hypothetical protein AURANDRAFT_63351 [Aureococcus anophagefferens]|uniref:Uncharacterized protein n=1 Tax=Aureococcus anophagefferens TaxID=44056 RepID=F0Y6C4_AURAN|nr:hypothetical protein AURANDRAFT_63351 [Aureococcus anophagefferens]EGB09639.1 hypothetical protein AURANDRAFT_63351 [Aureococcus anophagefferens]|eukprot:XP_009035689.1 hypothetical protein AURANDRAFT_63351 [Aureococcus anophagefferens]